MSEELNRDSLRALNIIRSMVHAAVAKGAKVAAGYFGLEKYFGTYRLVIHQTYGPCGCPLGIMMNGLPTDGISLTDGKTITQDAASFLAVSETWVTGFWQGFDRLAGDLRTKVEDLFRLDFEQGYLTGTLFRKELGGDVVDATPQLEGPDEL